MTIVFLNFPMFFMIHMIIKRNVFFVDCLPHFNETRAFSHLYFFNWVWPNNLLGGAVTAPLHIVLINNSFTVSLQLFIV